MGDYFNEVVLSLTIEDTNLLGILHEHDAVSKQKSIKIQTIFELSGTTEAKFRKMVDRLVSQRFAITNKDYKEHGLFISEYGIIALSSILQTMEVS